MSGYTIITDSCCDLGMDRVQQWGLKYTPLRLTDAALEHQVERAGAEGIHLFYEAMRGGAAPKTSATTTEQWIQNAQPELEAGRDVLMLTFSSALSGTYQAAHIAAQELGEQFPGRKVIAVDTRCASLGLGLLLYHVVQQQRSGATIEEAAAYAESHKLQLCHWFTVDSLTYLRRGGRISGATALAGTILGIKPVMHVDDEGRLVAVGKRRGRKASMEALADQLAETAIRPEEQTIFISHGDCLDEAKQLEQMIRSRTPIKDCYINPVGPVIGAHSGPGTLALFFYGTHR